MLSRCQYEILSAIRERTDGIDYRLEVLPPTYNRDDIWRFFWENDFIEGGESDVAIVTFLGRVILAAYEEQQC